jgi:hypothetical protein
MKYTWDCDDEFETEIMGRMVNISYHSEGYYESSTWDDPSEGESEISDVGISWNSYGSTFEASEFDRNWKRLQKFCPSFIEQINEAVTDHDSEQSRN